MLSKNKKLGVRGVVLIIIATGWICFILFFPLLVLVWEAFKHGIHAFLLPLLNPEAKHAIKLTIIITLSAVGINTLFGLPLAFLIGRYRTRMRALIDSLLNLPLAVSPVVAGLMFLLLFGREGIFRGILDKGGIEIVFRLPGMILATVFVSLPFVVREVVPVLEEVGWKQEESAWTLGAGWLRTFFRVTVPQIRWGLIYGMTLTTARAMGEFGAVMVVSGNIIGKTQTATLHINQALADFDYQSAYSCSFLIGFVSFFIILIVQKIYTRKKS